jgi:hypothetical protein
MNSERMPELQVEILIEGHLDLQWSDWFDGLSIDFPTPGNTLLKGSLPDQSALFGVLKKIHNLGLGLVSVQRIG